MGTSSAYGSNSLKPIQNWARPVVLPHTEEMDGGFDGLGVHLGNLSRLSNATTRSISPENRTGAKGGGGMAESGTGAAAARELGIGWKVSPSLELAGGAITTLAEIEGPGAIQHMWMTVRPAAWRHLILRCFWDGEAQPSIEAPVGDLFCCGWCKPCRVASVPVAVNPQGGFNSYWEMPFRQSARITIENLSPDPVPGFYYQVDYALTEVSEDAAYLHAQWRRSNPVQTGDVHTILDGVTGRGHYVGTYLAWGAHANGWWGEGEVKFYLDGDAEWPTICGTGTEDYFGGAWAFDEDGEYGVYSTPYLGMPQAIQHGGMYESQHRFGAYRWHVPDPIRFQSDARVTVQSLGWRAALGGKKRYLQRLDDVASTAFWYQAEPHQAFPELGDLNHLEVV